MRFFLPSVLAFGLLLVQPGNILPQKNTQVSTQISTVDLFGSDEVLDIKLLGSVRELLDDRVEKPTYYPLVLTYMAKDSSEVAIKIRARTRGHFRRDKENCDYPPILLNFTKQLSKSTLFENQDKLKLVTPCQGDNYIFREWLVYKMYNLVTEKSFKARLVRIQPYDTKKKKELASMYGILLEEEKQMAARNNMKPIERKLVRGEHTDKESFLKMVMFQYMIGNTDWSVPYLHNTRLIAADSLSTLYTVPYDFDHAGIVGAHYANPPPELNLSSTKQRCYRGYCITDMKSFNEVLSTFKKLKKDFYKLYTGCPFFNARYVSNTTKFLDQFYETINNAKKLSAAINGPCGKGHVDIVIKGLSSD